jgi:serine/threonine protein kinase
MNESSTTVVNTKAAAFPIVDPKEALDAYARGSLDDGELIALLLLHCRDDSDATWEALSQLDQYHRRGLIETSLFLTAKTELNFLAFGSPPSGCAVAAHRASPAAALDQVAGGIPDVAEVAVVAEVNTSSVNTSSRDAAVSAAPSKRHPLRAGTVLGDRYVLIAPLASTSTTTIFKAFDRQRAGLPEIESFVSIKCLRDEFANSSAARSALEREFTMGSDLSHPNILRLYDFCQGDHCFIVTEFLQGQLLNHVIERLAPQAMQPSQALSIVREIGFALAYAHQQGVSHTNLSSETIVILPSGEVRVSGFAAAEPRLHNAGAQRDVTGDLFSLACIAYHLLSGREPIKKGSGKRGQWQRITTLPTRQWRAIERALNNDGIQQRSSVRDWLTSLDNGSTHCLTPLSELRPAPTANSFTRSKPFLAAASILAAAILVTMWVSFPGQSSELLAYIQPGKSQRADLSVQPTMASRLATDEPAAIKDLASAQASQETHAGLPQLSQQIDSPATLPLATPTTASADATAPSGAKLQQTGSSGTSSEIASENASVAELGVSAAAATPPPEPTTIALTPANTAINQSASITPTVSFTADQFTVNEGEAAAKITLRRTGSTRRELRLQWRTTEGSAKAHREFAAIEDGVVVFAPGERTAVAFVPIVNQGAMQFSQWFGVEITSTQHADLGVIADATVFIVPAWALAATNE